MTLLKLFIDDIRMPSDVGYKDSDWLITRSYLAGEAAIIFEQPQEISFDHDLGKPEGQESREKTGYDLAKLLVDLDLQRCYDKDKNVWKEHDRPWIGKDFKFTVHSANPVGKKNIEALLNGYIKYKFGQ